MEQNDYNVILVKEGVRPSMLVQPPDYGEFTSKDPNTKAYLQKIKKQFPDLIHSEVSQGILISKQELKGPFSNDEMGKILGYPCANELNGEYIIDLIIHKDGQMIPLFTNICKKPLHLHTFHTFAKEAEKVFQKYGLQVKVDVKITKQITTDSILKKCIHGQLLKPSEMDTIQTMLFNFGFSMDLQFYFMDHFQYHNLIHRGILIDLLIKEKNDVLLPFSPIQKEQDEKLKPILEQMEKDIRMVLEKTQIKNKTKKRGVRP